MENEKHKKTLDSYFNSSGSLSKLGKTLLRNLFELSESKSIFFLIKKVLQKP
jgi:hypothetical protein